jgi:hypothetical protein
MRRERERRTATGRSRPRETLARRAEVKVSRGEVVGVEKKRRCCWKAVYGVRDILGWVGVCWDLLREV